MTTTDPTTVYKQNREEAMRVLAEACAEVSRLQSLTACAQGAAKRAEQAVRDIDAAETRRLAVVKRKAGTYIDFAGYSLKNSQWAKLTGVSVGVLTGRLNSGWRVGDALCIPTGMQTYKGLCAKDASKVRYSSKADYYATALACHEVRMKNEATLRARLAEGGFGPPTLPVEALGADAYHNGELLARLKEDARREALPNKERHAIEQAEQQEWMRQQIARNNADRDAWVERVSNQQGT